MTASLFPSRISPEQADRLADVFVESCAGLFDVTDEHRNAVKQAIFFVGYHWELSAAGVRAVIDANAAGEVAEVDGVPPVCAGYLLGTMQAFTWGQTV